MLRANWDASKLEFIEEFKVVLLNRANRVLGIVNASSGGTCGTVVDLKVFFAAAKTHRSLSTHYNSVC
ncbi:JAB domain-containing protein [Echinicola rosea]|uniref:JAB domain-containing protein n=1 Tax=Echinicola rosea TaxID=1807691 RepID=UPI003743ACAC